jgi:hypothetical protein
LGGWPDLLVHVDSIQRSKLIKLFVLQLAFLLLLFKQFQFSIRLGLAFFAVRLYFSDFALTLHYPLMLLIVFSHQTLYPSLEHFVFIQQLLISFLALV